MMVVVAMLVVVMVVMMMTVITVVMVVIIMATVMMTMIVRRMVMRGVGVGFGSRMRMEGVGISAAFGVERRLDLDHARAQPPHHRLDDVIAPDPQALAHDLGRQMTVAEMPGDPNQMVRVVAADLGQRLGCRDHLDQPAVVEHQRVAAAQRDRIFQIEQKFQPAGAGHRHPPPVTIVEIEHDGVGRRLAPAILAMDSGGADHANALFLTRFLHANRFPLRLKTL